MSDHNGYWVLGGMGEGVFEYQCPSCNVIIFSHDLWWHYHEDSWDFSFDCKICEVKLKTYWDKKSGEQYITLDNKITDE